MWCQDFEFLFYWNLYSFWFHIKIEILHAVRISKQPVLVLEPQGPRRMTDHKRKHFVQKGRNLWRDTTYSTISYLPFFWYFIWDDIIFLCKFIERFLIIGDSCLMRIPYSHYGWIAFFCWEAFMKDFIGYNIFVIGMRKHTVVDKFGIKLFEF